MDHMNELEHPLMGYVVALYDKAGHIFQEAQQPHTMHIIQLSLEARLLEQLPVTHHRLKNI